MSPFLSDALLRTQSDERLAALAAAGRDRAFEVLVERHRRSLLTFARHAVGAGRAEDVVQQALLQAWRSLAAGAEVEHVRGWLHQIVRHTAWRAARAAADERLPDSLVGSPGPQDEVERRMEVSAVVASLAAMPERQRAAIVQTVLEGQSQREVAASLGLTEGAVRQLVHRGRTFLRTAATAVVPLPLASWAAGLAGGAGSPAAERIAEGVAGAGSAGVAGLVAKGGIAFVAAGAVATGVATEAVHKHHRAHRHASPPAARIAAVKPAKGGTNGARTPVVLRTAATPVVAPASHPEGGGGAGRSGPGGGGSANAIGKVSGSGGSARSGDSSKGSSGASGKSGSGDDSSSSKKSSGSDQSQSSSSDSSHRRARSGDDGSDSSPSGPAASPEHPTESSSSGPGSGGDHHDSVTVPTVTTPEPSGGNGSDTSVPATTGGD